MSDVEIGLLTLIVMAVVGLIGYVAYSMGHVNGHNDGCNEGHEIGKEYGIVVGERRAAAERCQELNEDEARKESESLNVRNRARFKEDILLEVKTLIASSKKKK